MEINYTELADRTPSTGTTIHFAVTKVANGYEIIVAPRPDSDERSVTCITEHAPEVAALVQACVERMGTYAPRRR